MVRGRAVVAHFGTQGLALALCVMVARPAEVIPRVEVLEGDGAINNIKLHRAKEPVVRVADQDGHPLANVAVTFLLPEKGPGGSFADGKNTLTVMTDADGRAVGRGLRPNNSAGQFQIHVTASFQGQAAVANIMQTNATPAQGGSSKTLLIVLLIGGAAAGGGAAAALGKGGSSSSTTPPPTSTGVVITPGSPSFGHP